MGIMQLWGGHDTDDDMARAKARTIDRGKVDSWVEQLKATVKDRAAFKDVYSSLSSARDVSVPEAIEIAQKFAGQRTKTKKDAIRAIGQEGLRVSHARAKGQSAAKTRTW